MALENTKKDVTYVNVLSDGTMRVVVTEDTPGAVRRDYETSDEKKGTKFELVFTRVSGIIDGIEFYDGDFGKVLQLTIVDGDEKPVVLCLNTSSNFGEDMMKKLPALDLTKPVVISPFAFEDDNGKSRKGVTVIQEEKKAQNFFYDFHLKENANGYPSPVFKKDKQGEPKPFSKEEWKLYFGQCRIFLIEYTEEHFLKKPSSFVNHLDDAAKDRAKVDALYDNMSDPDIDPANIPF